MIHNIPIIKTEIPKSKSQQLSKEIVCKEAD